ncbi:MAG TPA: hypothetical protein VIB07_06715 [Nitrososphaera sp.]
MSGSNRNSLVLIVIPVAAIAIGLSVVFAFGPVASSPPEQPTKDVDCTSLAGSVKYLVIDIDGDGTNETRRAAASALMNEYCGRPELITEIDTMAFPSVGLISYGCDSASGRIGDENLQESLRDYATIYCEGATLAVLERAEWMGLAVHDFEQEMDAYLEEQKQIFDHAAEISNDGPDTEYPWVETDEIEKTEAKLVEITGVIENARALAFDGQYYDAALSLESANSSLIQLGSDFYS